MVAVLAFQHIECSEGDLFVDDEWQNVTISSKFLVPEIKWSQNVDGSIKVCLPLQTKWIRSRDKIDTKGKSRKATQLKLQKKWRHVRSNLMKKIGSKYEDVFTYTVMERVQDKKAELGKAESFFVTTFFNIGEMNKSELDLKCSDGTQCAYPVNSPPSCFISISPKKKVGKMFSIPIALAKEFKYKGLKVKFFEELPECSC